MKRKLAFAIAALLILSFASCGTNNKAERDLVVQLEIIKNINEPALRLAYNAGIKDGADEALQNFGVTSDQAIKVVAAFFKNFNYKIQSSSLDGDKADVKCAITMPNFTSLSALVASDVIQKSLPNVMSGTTDMSSAVVESILSALSKSDIDLKTTDATVHMTNGGGSTYRIIYDEGFIDAVSGGAISFLRLNGMGEQADMIITMLQSFLGGGQ